MNDPGLQKPPETRNRTPVDQTPEIPPETRIRADTRGAYFRCIYKNDAMLLSFSVR